ncbi:MAG: alpha/beta hydrolase [Pseudomonadota bacterium]
MASGDERPVVICIAGFGDNAEMFSSLLATPAANRVRFEPFDLPGFGAPALPETSLDTLAKSVSDHCRALGARIVVAHSVASIVASLAAVRDRTEGMRNAIGRIVSLEGNLTPEDAYFSGTAADYDDPLAFREAFLSRLDQMVAGGGVFASILAGYRKRVETADSKALWDLGRDARAFGRKRVPGDLLKGSADVTYLFNPDNCPPSSLDYLMQADLKAVELRGASHWPTIDRAEAVAELIAEAALA